MLCNKDYIKKMTVEDFLKLCGINPDDDDQLACVLESNSDSSVFYSGCGVEKPLPPFDCTCCVYCDDSGDECADGLCRDGIIEWLNLEHKEPIPVVCKPFSYKGQPVAMFAISVVDDEPCIVLYDDDDCDDSSILGYIPFSKEEQEKMYNAVGYDSNWQWNYIVDMFGDKEPITVVTDESVEKATKKLYDVSFILSTPSSLVVEASSAEEAKDVALEILEDESRDEIVSRLIAALCYEPKFDIVESKYIDDVDDDN